MTPTVDEVQATLAEILAGPDYQPVTPSLLQRGLTAAMRWFRETVWEPLAGLLPAPDWSSPAWEMATFVAFTLGAILGVALVVYLVVLAVRAFRRRQRRRQGTGAAASAAPSLSAADWEARSAAAARRGDWRAAAHGLYQAVLLRLAASDAVRVDASKTPGDYRREVRRTRTDLAGPVDRFLAGFERMAYGTGADGEAGFDRLRQTAADLGGRG